MLVKDSIWRSIAFWIGVVLKFVEVLEVLRGAFESGHIVNGLIACPFTHSWRHGGHQIPASCCFFAFLPLFRTFVCVCVCLSVWLYVAANPLCDGILGPLKLWLTAGACVLSFMHIIRKSGKEPAAPAAFPYRLSTWSAWGHKDDKAIWRDTDVRVFDVFFFFRKTRVIPYIHSIKLHPSAHAVDLIKYLFCHRVSFSTLHLFSKYIKSI